MTTKLTPADEAIVESFYQLMLESTPKLNSFERASLKLKVQSILTQKNKQTEETINKLRQCIDDEGVSCERKIEEVENNNYEYFRSVIHQTANLNLIDNDGMCYLLQALLTKE